MRFAKLHFALGAYKSWLRSIVAFLFAIVFGIVKFNIHNEFQQPQKWQMLRKEKENERKR